MALPGSCQTLKCYGNKFQKSNEGQSSCIRQLSHSHNTFLHHARCTLKLRRWGGVTGNISNEKINELHVTHFKFKQMIHFVQFIFYFWFSLVDCATIMSSTFRCLPGESNVDQSTCIKSTCFVDHQGYSMKHTRGEISWFYNKKLVNSEYPPPKKNKKRKNKQTNKKNLVGL